ncbi:MAG: multiheme c-type cytochrome [Thermodesulfobacteriota bacterium]
MDRIPGLLPFLFLFHLLLFPSAAFAARAPVSEATEECLACHASLHPGIVADWRKSRHAEVAPETALKVTGLARKVSAESVPEELAKTSVGCAECHTLRPEAHADTFDHVGAAIHVVVSPDDCAVCHVDEAAQYGENLMSHAHGNLTRNPVYRQLEEAVLGSPVRAEGRVVQNPPSAATRAEGCLHCHGTRLTVRGMTTRDTMMGEMMFPKIDGWPNQGAGRINPDGSRGSCAACHTRHLFSIETARKPHTCKKCHVGPDVPAYKVYSASKHGNLYSSHGDDWDFRKVPWTAGADFNAPTCATCHISLVVNTDGAVVAERTHRMSGRLPWRIFGLIYAHPHPANPDTTTIRNREGLPLPTSLDGTFATEHLLITPAEQARRTETMQAVCLGCHHADWVTGHWDRFENTIRTSNAAIRTATQIMNDIWSRGYAKGIAQGENPFDESVERMWSDAWLFYGNTIRFASAMAGGGDYGVFADGRYQLNQTIRDLDDWLDLRTRLFPSEGPMADAPGNGTPQDGPRLSLRRNRHSGLFPPRRALRVSSGEFSVPAFKGEAGRPSNPGAGLLPESP